MLNDGEENWSFLEEGGPEAGGTNVRIAKSMALSCGKVLEGARYTNTSWDLAGARGVS